MPSRSGLYASYDRSTAILMVGGHGYARTANPVKPHDHWLYDGLIVHVMQQGVRGPKDQPRLELWSGSGDSPYYEAGQRVLAHHDQSGVTKGVWTCVGAVRWYGDERPAEVIFGDVPSRKIAHGVFK